MTRGGRDLEHSSEDTCYRKEGNEYGGGKTLKLYKNQTLIKIVEHVKYISCIS